jgi:LysM repeat protein
MPPQQQQQAVPMAERPTETLAVGDQGGQQAVVMPSATPAEVAMLQATLSPIQMTSTVVVYNATATAAALMGQPLQPQGQQPVQQASPIFQTTPIPGTTPLVTPIPGQTCGSHLVSPGDNLFRIALSYNVTVDQMALANNIVNPDLILAGATLIVPCPLPASATTTTTTTTAVTTTGQGGLSAGNTYIVEPGDTLYRISLQYGVSMSALMQANGLTPATINMIYAGDQLVIPVGATTTVQPTAFPTAAIQQQQQQPVSPIG